MNWAPEALPQTEAEVRNEPRCPEIVDAAVKRGVTSIVHFTRSRPGLVGILDSSAVKARRDLPEDARLRHVYEDNAADRSRDQQWHGYVNLSITGLNKWMFQASKRWYPKAEWVILDFSPEILGDPGVVFCTTNNAYPTAHRHAGIKGFNQMFASMVPGYTGHESTRSRRGLNQTTDHQAEVLYPSVLSLNHLQSVIVGDESTCDTVEAALASFPHHAPRIAITPEAFE